MRQARLVAILVAIIIAVVVVVAAVLPGVTDWNRYRGSLEVLAGEALGRSVTIAGPVSLSLLPEPVLTASRVSVSGRAGTRVTVAELRLRVALLPLLTGRVDARSLTLQRPVFRLPWPPWRDVALAAPLWPQRFSARIEGGRVETGGIVLTSVDATLLAGRGAAGLTLLGSAAVGKSTWNLTLTLGAPDAEGIARLDADLAGAGAAQGIAARLTGELPPNGRLAGQLALDGPKLAELTAAPALPFHLGARYTLGRAAVRLSDLTLTLGRISAKGSGTLALGPAPRLDLALASENTVPLDPWVSSLRDGGQSRLPIGLSFAAPRGILAGGLLQHLDLAMVLGPRGARIGAFRAILPGNASFAAEGRLVHPASGPGWQFEGTAHLAAPALFETVHWLTAAAPGVLPPLPPTALREADIGGRVVVGANEIALSDLVGTLDRSKLTGSLSLGLGRRPAIRAGLALDQLDLDAWLPQGFWDLSSQHPFPLAKIPAFFAGMSIELRLTADQAHLGRTVISGLALDAAADPGQVILRRLDATVDGVHAIASGSIGAKGTVTAGRLALTAPGPAVPARLLPPSLQTAIAKWRSPFSLDATAAGPPQALRLTLAARLGDLRFEARPIVDLSSGSWHGPVSLRHPGAAELISASGFANPIRWLGPGSLSLIGEATVGPLGWSLNDFRLIAGALHASGSLAERGSGEIAGHVDATILPVPAPGRTALQLPLALSGIARINIGVSARRVTAARRTILEDAKGRLQVARRQTTLEFTADVPGGGALAAVLSAPAATGPPRFRLGAALSGVRLKGGLSDGVPDLVAGTLDARLSLSAVGYGPDALLATLGGTVAATVQQGMLSGFSLAGVRAALTGGTDAAARKGALETALQDGHSRFARLDLFARGQGGRFQLVRARMVASDGSVDAGGTLDLPTRSETLRLAIRPAVSGGPELVIRLGGPMERPKRVDEISAALQWRSREPDRPPAARP